VQVNCEGGQWTPAASRAGGRVISPVTPEVAQTGKEVCRKALWLKIKPQPVDESKAEFLQGCICFKVESRNADMGVTAIQNCSRILSAPETEIGLPVSDLEGRLGLAGERNLITKTLCVWPYILFVLK
jgi:hypothetical protein